MPTVEWGSSPLGALPPGSLLDHSLSERVHLEHLGLAELLRMPVFKVWWEMAAPSQCPAREVKLWCRIIQPELG